MNKYEIKKALECCVKLICDNCPYRNNIHCIGETQQDAHELITEQEKEIEKQNSRVRCLKTRLANKMVLLADVEEQYEYKTKCFEEEKQILADTIKNQEKEIERLKANINQSQDQILETAQKNQEYREQQVKQAKIDVLNELTVKAVSLSAIETYHICNLVDELIKEIKK